mgnify:CR=1 FL=1
MNRSLFLLFPLLAGALGLSAQPGGIRGLVLDPDARPVPGARVVCGSRLLTTDAEGRFGAPEVDSCRAVISAPGFQTRILDLDGAGEARVGLEIAWVASEVLVTATRGPATPEQAALSASVLTRTDLEGRQ